MLDSLHLRVMDVEHKLESATNIGALVSALELVNVLELETGEYTGWLTRHAEKLVPQMKGTLTKLTFFSDGAMEMAAKEAADMAKQQEDDGKREAAVIGGLQDGFPQFGAKQPMSGMSLSGAVSPLQPMDAVLQQDQNDLASMHQAMTSEQPAAKTCEVWCSNIMQQWDIKCQLLPQCGACSECMGDDPGVGGNAGAADAQYGLEATQFAAKKDAIATRCSSHRSRSLIWARSLWMRKKHYGLGKN